MENNITLSDKDKIDLKYISETLVSLYYYKPQLQKKWGKNAYEQILAAVQHELSDITERMEIEAEDADMHGNT
ncbi:MAG: hypothetical protein WDA42_00585 [Candidatus Bathyarchaeia archaeon]|jgi:hypothetical protein